MVPTARAMELAEPVADILARVRRVVSTAEPFDATKSARRFTIGAPDGGLRRHSCYRCLPVCGVRLPASKSACGSFFLHIKVEQSNTPGSPLSPSWETRAIDIAIVPLDEIPARFVDRILYEKDFVIATRAEHPFADDPTLDRYCGMRHLVVSLTGDV